ncbi:MAG TPA: hypothetical protein DCL86_17895 [Bacteroidales bacterium]|nr:hypothetical protein [Bacteroidales bacterium]
MKKQFIIVVFQLFLLNISVFSQDFWELLPFPDSLDINCLAVNQQGDIFVGTNTSTAYDGVFRSLDEGQTWELVLDMGLYGPASIAITDNGYIYSLGGSQGFYLTKSIDNGLTWESLAMPDYGGNVKIIAHGNDTLFVSQWAANGALLLKSENGGLDWEVVFTTENHTSEFVADIDIAPNGDICIGLGCYLPDMGGLYRSTNGGSDWDFLGLFNRMVENLEYNAQGDLIIGVRGGVDGIGGIYTIYHDNPDQIVECLAGPNINGLVLNSAGHIYAGTAWPHGILVSTDNGLSFHFENNGLPYYPIGKIESDNDDYVYALMESNSHFIYRSIEPTVTSVKDINISEPIKVLSISPNPAYDIVVGRFDTILTDGIYGFKIADMSGRSINCGRINLSRDNFSLDVSHLSPGFYVLTVNYNESAYSAKIIRR